MNTVWVKKSAYILLLEEALRGTPCETGGVLIGYWAGASDVLVTDVVGPGPRAVHGPNSFVPDYDFHNAEVSRHYRKSGREETYLGDWHTHPQARAYLSERDKKTLKGIAAFKEARLEKPLMMILGTRPFGLCAWTHTYKRRWWDGPAIAPCDLRFF